MERISATKIIVIQRRYHHDIAEVSDHQGRFYIHHI